MCKGEEGEFSVKSQKRVEGCSVSILHGCSTDQGSCCKAKSGEIGGSEEPKSTKIVVLPSEKAAWRCGATDGSSSGG